MSPMKGKRRNSLNEELEENLLDDNSQHFLVDVPNMGSKGETETVISANLSHNKMWVIKATKEGGRLVEGWKLSENILSFIADVISNHKEV